MSEYNYIETNAEIIWAAMREAYAESGGNVLYPGDEKMMHLQAVLEILVRASVSFNNAAKKRTLGGADLTGLIEQFGDPRGVAYQDAEAATAQMTMTFQPLTQPLVLEEGELFTQDGTIYWKLDERVSMPVSAAQGTVTVAIRCQTAGAEGNSLAAGAEMFPVKGQPLLRSCVAASDASGGRDAEDVESYRERVRTGNPLKLTTGPSEAYRAQALAISTDVLDAWAYMPQEDGEDLAGHVEVPLILADGLSVQAKTELVAQVRATLSPDTTRPLTDYLTVSEAQAQTFHLTVMVGYPALGASDAAGNAQKAVQEYIAWQTHTLGRPCDPYYLIGLLYAAGVERAYIDTQKSSINGGDVAHTAIARWKRWTGEVTLTEITS